MVAIERGAKYVAFDPNEYTGTEEMKLTVLHEYWAMDSWWTNYLIIYTAVGLAIFMIYLDISSLRSNPDSELKKWPKYASY